MGTPNPVVPLMVSDFVPAVVPLADCTTIVPEFPGVTAAGGVQVSPAGGATQLSVTGSVKPFCAFTAMANVVPAPAGMVREVGVEESVKLCTRRLRFTACDFKLTGSVAVTVTTASPAG